MVLFFKKKHFLLLACLATASCATAPPAKITFPDQIGDFTRQSVAASGSGAGYGDNADDATAVTVRIGRQAAPSTLVPELNLGEGDGLDAAVAKAGAGIRRFYPAASLTLDEPLYLMRDGTLEAGRHQSWRYRDQGQEVAMDFVISCCNDRGELVSVWFRHRAEHPIEPVLLGFLNALPWQ